MIEIEYLINPSRSDIQKFVKLSEVSDITETINLHFIANKDDIIVWGDNFVSASMMLRQLGDDEKDYSAYGSFSISSKHLDRIVSLMYVSSKPYSMISKKSSRKIFYRHKRKLRWKYDSKFVDFSKNRV